MSFKARDEADVRLHECPAIDLRGHGHVGPNILVLQMKCLKECPHVRENRRHLRHLLFGEANSVEDLVLGYGSEFLKDWCALMQLTNAGRVRHCGSQCPASSGCT